jgi:hypothetical protein
MSGHLKFRFTIDGLVKSQKSDDNVAALPELGQGAQPGNDPDGTGCSATQQMDFQRT